VNASGKLIWICSQVHVGNVPSKVNHSFQLISYGSWLSLRKSFTTKKVRALDQQDTVKGKDAQAM
jgi:hypothetical protein